MHSHQASTFETLTSEMLFYLFSFSNFKDLASMMLVNKYLYAGVINALNSNHFWKNKLKDDYVLFYEFILSTRENNKISWKEEYVAVEEELKAKLKIDSFKDPFNGFQEPRKESLDLNIIKIIRENKTEEFKKHFFNPNIKNQTMLFALWLNNKEIIQFDKAQNLKQELLQKIIFHDPIKEILEFQEKNNQKDLEVFYPALVYGNLDLVKHFYDKKIFNNQSKITRFETPLSIACRFGHLALCQYLWNIEIKELAKDPDIFDPFRLATLFRYNHVNLIKFCIDHDLERMMIPTTSNILSFSSSSDDEDSNAEQDQHDHQANSKFVIDNEGPIIDLSIYQTFSDSIQHRYLNILQYLLQKYPDQSYKNYALYEAAKQNRLEIVKYLIEKEGADIEYVMPRDLLNGAMPKNVTPFQIAHYDTYVKTTSLDVAKYLFYKLTLPMLPIQPDQIHLEQNTDILLNQLKYMIDTFDQHWLNHLEKEWTIEFTSLTGDPSFIKKIPYHSPADFVLWFFELLKKHLCHLIDIHQDKLNKQIANFKAQSSILFSGSKQSNLEKLRKNMIALDHLRELISSMMSIDSFSKEMQEDLPDDMLPVVDLLKQYVDKSKKYPSLQELKQDSEGPDDNSTGNDSDSEEAYYSPGRY